VALPLIVPLAIGGGLLAFALKKKAPPPPPPGGIVVPHPSGGGIVVPPLGLPKVLPPNTVIPSPITQQDPATNGVIVNPTTPAGARLRGTVVTLQSGVPGRLFVHSTMDTTTASRSGFLEHGEVVNLLSSEISPHFPTLPTDVSWYHVEKLDGSLDGFVDASFISEDINN